MTKTYVFLGIPRSGKNSSVVALNKTSGKRFVRKSRASIEWMATIRKQAYDQRGRGPMLRGPVRADAVYYQRANVCDGDNMESAMWDAIKTVLIEDDKHIVAWSGIKLVDRANPRIEVTLAPYG